MPEGLKSRSAFTGQLKEPICRFFKSDGRLMAFLVIGTPLSLLVGFLLGRYLLPLVQALVAFPPFLVLVTGERWRRAFLAMAFWAVLTSVSVGVASYYWPSSMSDAVLNSQNYQSEMFHWIATGVGPEGDIRQFFPEHLLHFGVFSLLTLISAGFLGLVMGSVLVNYMSFYVGTLLLKAEWFWVVLVMGWPPWAILRVFGFILCALFLASLTIRSTTAIELDLRGAKRGLALGITCLLSDIVLKWSLAPLWRDLLSKYTLL